MKSDQDKSLVRNIFLVSGILLMLVSGPSIVLGQVPERVRAQVIKRAVLDLPAAAQGVRPAQVPGIKPADNQQQAKAVTEPIIDTADSIQDGPAIGDQYAQLHLQDGSIIGGEIQASSIDIKTSYGMLTVPISRIVQIYPGLNCRPEFIEKISKLVDELGGTSAAGRDASQKELLSMGATIRNVLSDLSPDSNAEQKKRIAKILTTFEEEIESDEEDLMDMERSITFDDTIITPGFSIVGKIQQQQFEVKSKFGDLRVQLGDIKYANRKLQTKAGETRKSVKIPAMAFFQTKPQSTGIRVNKGDKVSIRADGSIQWVNFNASSTPQGLTNRNQWNRINSGKLTARVGSDNRQCTQIGTSGDFIAKTSGILYLGIAMRDSYATNPSYNWSGEYKAKIVVKPKRK